MTGSKDSRAGDAPSEKSAAASPGREADVPCDKDMAASPRRVADLLADVPYQLIGDRDVTVGGIAYASNKVRRGDVFFCVPGLRADGHDFAADAVSRGAAALVCQRELSLDVPQFIVSDSRRTLALASSAFFDHPSESFDLVGVTGTNGKTTTAYLTEWIARQRGHRTGLIGTVEVRIAGEHLPAIHTTPESYDLQELFARMRDASVDSAVMEVSSHALDLDRTAGTTFAVAAFSNLTQDHLDYHGTMEAYFQAKRRLFTEYHVPKAAICVDDEYGKRLASDASRAGSQVLTCGFDGAASVRPEDMDYDMHGTSFTLRTPRGDAHVRMPLIGRFNVSNALLASTIALLEGTDPAEIAAALASSPQVPGRLERVRPAIDRPFAVYVDYAHTPDAIEKALDVVCKVKENRCIIVFGCGGDRDARKRPLMGRAALAADFCVVTSDNPRSEDPLAIIDDILPGMAGSEDRFEVVPDRREAIRRAVSMAGPGDVVLIAGKGHEDYQLVGDKVLDFDDRIVAAEEMDGL